MKYKGLVSAFINTFLLLQLTVDEVTSLNVLITHPLYGGSHVLTLQALGGELLNRGHKVTTLMFRDSNLPTLKNLNHQNFTLKELTVNNANGKIPYISKSKEGEFRLPMELVWENGNHVVWSYKMVLQSAYTLAMNYCKTMLSDNMIRDLKKMNLDVILIDLMFNECGLAMAHQIGVPTVAYWSTFSCGQQEYTTLPGPTSYVPVFMSKLSDKMTFWDRTLNTVVKLFTRLYMVFYHSAIINPVLREIDPEIPPGWKLLANLNGMLLNTDDIIDYPRPKPPTFINIGGLQIQETPDKLSNELQVLMDSSKNGVILFTMGFIFDSKAVPRSMVENLMTAFSRLPQTVIFKYKLQMSDLKVPKNVRLMSWVPQQSILAHKNTVLFITHCGMHGTLESIYHAVPMVGIPVFIDQGDVMRRIVDKGIGVGIDKSASSDTIYNAVVQVRDNPKYKQNAIQLSRVMRDRKESPMEAAAFLVEYIGRNKGATHLRLSSGDLSLIEYYCLDAILLIVVVVFALVAFIIFMLNKMATCLSRSTNNEKKYL